MATFTVTTSADVVNAGDGALSLREAVQQANAAAGADTILFAASLEGGTLTLGQGQLALRHDTAIDGDRDDDGTAVTVSAGDASRVLAVEDAARVELRDLTLADGRVLDEPGAGVRVGTYGSLRLENSTVIGCDAGESALAFGTGGGIYLASGSRLDMADSVVTGNTAYGTGGGIAMAPRSTAYLEACVVSGNGALYGAGIDTQGFLDVDGSAILGNGVYTYNNDTGRGGGLRIGELGAAVITRTLIAANSAPDGGGLYSLGLARLSDSTVAENAAFGDEFPGQTAGLSGANISLERCTVTGNYTTNDGFYYTGAAGLDSDTARVSDSIIVGNFNRGGPSDVSGTLAFSNGRNLFGNVAAGSAPGDLENVDPAAVFAEIDPDTGGGRLVLDGGFAATAALRDAADNPALNAAEPVEPGTVDQRGVARPSPAGTNPDLGAFELAQSSVPTTPSTRNDVLTGTTGADTISGLAGADLIRGLGGDDRLFGNDGGDTLRGDAGADLLEGGLGSDWIHGGAGTDRVSYFNDASARGVSIDLMHGRATRGGELDRLFEIENADGTDNNDVLRGDREANRLGGAGGSDQLFGGLRDDVLNGGPGNDRLNGGDDWDRVDLDLADYAAGGAVVVDLGLATDTATRGREVDTLVDIEGAVGSAGADTFRGDAQANLFRGNAGKDTQTGGAGADRFDYDRAADSLPGAGRDVVTDFAHLSDKLDLATIDTRAATPAVNDSFTFLAAKGSAFSAAGQVRWYQSGGATFVEASTDGDIAPELQIELLGLRPLSVADFVL